MIIFYHKETAIANPVYFRCFRKGVVIICHFDRAIASGEISRILSCIQRDFSMRSRCSLSRNDIIIEIKHLSGTPFISCPDCNACLIHTPFTAPCLKHIKLKALRNDFYLLMPFRSSGQYPPSYCSCHSSSPLRKK